jgi:hypothetical protein
MIKPTVGRVVWMRNRPGCDDDSQPEDAHIIYVHSDTCVNLVGFNKYGTQWSMRKVYLRQEGAEAPADSYCEWMPYQIGQAKKHEAEPAGITGTG